MSAQPVHDEDPRDPQVILRDLPDTKRGLFLEQYRAAVEAAKDPAGYRQLATLLRMWAVRVKVYRQHPNYDEEAEARAEEIRSGAAETVPLEQVLADYYGVPIEDAETIWAGKVAQARAERLRRTA